MYFTPKYTHTLMSGPQLYDNDPVRTTKLTMYIAGCVQDAGMACGGPANLQAMYLTKADPTVLNQLQAELARP